ncbi:hypothetical protein Q7P35_005452 [Cladosporium inversicolor]
MPPSTAAGSDGGRQNTAPNRSHKSPERPRAGKTRRTLIESACTACQRRKSRCDGIRPACSRCQTLHTECGYNAEEGESRWSALLRRNRTLEHERNEARDFIAQIQSRAELEAQEMVHQLRTNSHNSDIGSFIHEAVSITSGHASQQQPQGLGQSTQQMQPLYYGQQNHHHETAHQSDQQQHQQTAQLHTQQPRPALQQDQRFFAQPSYTSRSSPTAGPQLPPLRSVVEVPAGGHNSAQPPQPFPHFPQRNMSLGSNMSSGSYSSLSSSDGVGGQPLSPRQGPHSS